MSVVATTIGAGLAMPKAAKEEMVRSLINFIICWLPRFSLGGNREVNDEGGNRGLRSLIHANDGGPVWGQRYQGMRLCPNRH